MKKILLLDIENFHQSEKELIQLCHHYAYVYLAYAKSSVAISLDGLQALSVFIAEKRLVLIKMPSVGPDAADFGLAFLAGQLSVQLVPEDAVFEVMSNDKKFIYIVDLLKSMGFSAEQTKRDLPVKKLPKPSPQPDVLTQASADILVVKALNLLVKNQPKKSATLSNSLKSWMKLNSSEVITLINTLRAQKYIQIHADQVDYNLKAIQQHMAVKPSAQVPDQQQLKTKKHLMSIKQYCDFLQKTIQARPSKKPALVNSIMRFFNFDTSASASSFIQLLEKYQILTVDTRVIYSQPHIQEWSALHP